MRDDAHTGRPRTTAMSARVRSCVCSRCMYYLSRVYPSRYRGTVTLYAENVTPRSVSQTYHEVIFLAVSLFCFRLLVSLIYLVFFFPTNRCRQRSRILPSRRGRRRSRRSSRRRTRRRFRKRRIKKRSSMSLLHVALFSSLD